MYVVRCKDNSLYCGITTDVSRRVLEHNQGGRGAKYTRSRRPVTLVHSYLVGEKGEALRAELAFKKMSKAQKERLLHVKHAAK